MTRLDTRRLNSAAIRGRHVNTIARAILEQASSLWYVQSDNANSWQLRLGMRNQSTGEFHLDWAIHVDCRENAGAVEVTIHTPSFLTRDGALVNGDAHDKLRDLLIAAFRGQDGGAGAAAEIALGKQSLESKIVLDEPVDFTRFGDCAIRTVLTDETLGEVLRRVCLPLVESTPTRQVFRLGLDRPGVPPSFGTVAWDDTREAGLRALRLSFALQATGSTFLDAMATRGAFNLAKRLRNYVAIQDQSLQWTGPDLYSWAW
jgi:hypothetical protein